MTVVAKILQLPGSFLGGRLIFTLSYDFTSRVCFEMVLETLKRIQSDCTSLARVKSLLNYASNEKLSVK